jgi:adenylate cyclase
MFTDMVGYTGLTQTNEALAMEVLERHNRMLRPFFSKFNGREVKTIGDSFLVEFESALDATNCAIEVQKFLHDYNVSTRGDWKITLRIGIHLGDVVHSDNDVFGDAVNIASRLQPLADPEGICVSDQVFGQVRNKISSPLLELAPQDLKNVQFHVDVYKVVMPWENPTLKPSLDSDKNRIAVLPFANMSPDPNDEYFADGMTEELIDRLAQLKQLKVIARTSIMAYKKKDKGASVIAKELDVGSLVEGSVRKAGNRVRVTVQLINAGTQEHLWSSHYDGNLEDVFAVQAEIAEKVAGELKIQLAGSEKKTLEKKSTENTEAYTCFLKGRDLVREGSEPSLRRAVGLFERAISLDPSFARAHEGLSECFMTLGNDGYEPWEMAAPKAELAVRRALDLDPEEAEAHATLAYVHFLEDRIASCEVEARRALELNPSISEGHRELAFIALVRGDAKTGLVELETAWRLDPLRAFYIERLGQMYFYTGRESDALQFWEQTSQFAPAATYRGKTEYYLYKEDIGKAKASYEEARRLEPTHSWVQWMGGFIAAKTGDRDRALQSIKEIEHSWAASDALNQIGFIHYALGDLTSYFTYINKAVDQHVSRFIYVMYCPLFADSRSDPRYLDTLEKFRKVNLA